MIHLELDRNFEIVLNKNFRKKNLFFFFFNSPSVSEVVCWQCSSGKRQRTSSRSICRIDGNFGLYNCFLTDASLYLGVV